MKHTPLPWKLDALDRTLILSHPQEIYVADCHDFAVINAQFIVTACNTHEALIDHAGILLSLIRENPDKFPKGYEEKLANDLKLAKGDS